MVSTGGFIATIDTPTFMLSKQLTPLTLGVFAVSVVLCSTISLIAFTNTVWIISGPGSIANLSLGDLILFSTILPSGLMALNPGIVIYQLVQHL